MNLKKKLRLEDPGTKKRKADEKRRRLSYLKGKHQGQYQPSEARLPRPKPPRPSTMQTLRRLGVGAKRLNTVIQKQAKKMPSNTEMENFVWRSSEQKKKD